jgi:hypothetical protein
MGARTLSDWAVEVAKTAGIQNFQMKDMRSTAMTELSRLGYSKDLTGRLYSTGMGGVIDKHYNAYDYFEEKLGALQALQDMLNNDDETAKVVLIRKRRANGMGELNLK